MIPNIVYLMLFVAPVVTLQRLTVNELRTDSVESPVLSKILNTIDAVTNDEHLFEVTLKLLQSICACMHHTLKKKEELYIIQDEYYMKLDPSDTRSAKWKEIELYKKIYSKTCYRLRHELANKLNRTFDFTVNDEQIWNASNCGKKMEITTETVIKMSAESHPVLEANDKIHLENILYKALIETKDRHKYTIKRYGLFGHTIPFRNDPLKHSIIVIVTLYPNQSDYNKTNTNTEITSEKEFLNILHTNSPVDIDILDTRYGLSKNSTDDIEIVSDCMVQSVYAFLIESEKNNMTKVFKMLRRKGTVKVYVEVITKNYNVDYSTICCKPNTLNPFCNIHNHNFLSALNKMSRESYKDTVHKIMNLVKIYSQKLKDDNRTDDLIDQVEKPGYMSRSNDTDIPKNKLRIQLEYKENNANLDHMESESDKINNNKEITFFNPITVNNIKKSKLLQIETSTSYTTNINDDLGENTVANQGTADYNLILYENTNYSDTSKPSVGFGEAFTETTKNTLYTNTKDVMTTPVNSSFIKTSTELIFVLTTAPLNFESNFDSTVTPKDSVNKSEDSLITENQILTDNLVLLSDIQIISNNNIQSESLSNTDLKHNETNLQNVVASMKVTTTSSYNTNKESTEAVTENFKTLTHPYNTFNDSLFSTSNINQNEIYVQKINITLKANNNENSDNLKDTNNQETTKHSNLTSFSNDKGIEGKKSILEQEYYMVISKKLPSVNASLEFHAPNVEEKISDASIKYNKSAVNKNIAGDDSKYGVDNMTQTSPQTELVNKDLENIYMQTNEYDNADKRDKSNKKNIVPTPYSENGISMFTTVTSQNDVGNNNLEFKHGVDILESSRSDVWTTERNNDEPEKSLIRIKQTIPQAESIEEKIETLDLLLAKLHKITPSLFTTPEYILSTKQLTTDQIDEDIINSNDVDYGEKSVLFNTALKSNNDENIASTELQETDKSTVLDSTATTGSFKYDEITEYFDSSFKITNVMLSNKSTENTGVFSTETKYKTPLNKFMESFNERNMSSNNVSTTDTIFFYSSNNNLTKPSNKSQLVPNIISNQLGKIKQYHPAAGNIKGEASASEISEEIKETTDPDDSAENVNDKYSFTIKAIEAIPETTTFFFNDRTVITSMPEIQNITEKNSNISQEYISSNTLITEEIMNEPYNDTKFTDNTPLYINLETYNKEDSVNATTAENDLTNNQTDEKQLFITERDFNLSTPVYNSPIAISTEITPITTKKQTEGYISSIPQESETFNKYTYTSDFPSTQVQIENENEENNESISKFTNLTAYTYILSTDTTPTQIDYELRDENVIRNDEDKKTEPVNSFADFINKNYTQIKGVPNTQMDFQMLDKFVNDYNKKHNTTYSDDDRSSFSLTPVAVNGEINQFTNIEPKETVNYSNYFLTENPLANSKGYNLLDAEKESKLNPNEKDYEILADNTPVVNFTTTTSNYNLLLPLLEKYVANNAEIVSLYSTMMSNFSEPSYADENSANRTSPTTHQDDKSTNYHESNVSMNTLPTTRNSLYLDMNTENINSLTEAPVYNIKTETIVLPNFSSSTEITPELMENKLNMLPQTLLAEKNSQFIGLTSFHHNTSQKNDAAENISDLLDTSEPSKNMSVLITEGTKKYNVTQSYITDFVVNSQTNNTDNFVNYNQGDENIGDLSILSKPIYKHNDYEVADHPQKISQDDRHEEKNNVFDQLSDLDKNSLLAHSLNIVTDNDQSGGNGKIISFGSSTIQNNDMGDLKTLTKKKSNTTLLNTNIEEKNSNFNYKSPDDLNTTQNSLMSPTLNTVEYEHFFLQEPHSTLDANFETTTVVFTENINSHKIEENSNEDRDGIDKNKEGDNIRQHFFDNVLSEVEKTTNVYDLFDKLEIITTTGTKQDLTLTTIKPEIFNLDSIYSTKVDVSKDITEFDTALKNIDGMKNYVVIKDNEIEVNQSEDTSDTDSFKKLFLQQTTANDLERLNEKHTLELRTEDFNGENNQISSTFFNKFFRENFSQTEPNIYPSVTMASSVIQNQLSSTSFVTNIDLSDSKFKITDTHNNTTENISSSFVDISKDNKTENSSEKKLDDQIQQFAINTIIFHDNIEQIKPYIYELQTKTTNVNTKSFETTTELENKKILNEYSLYTELPTTIDINNYKTNYITTNSFVTTPISSFRNENNVVTLSDDIILSTKNIYENRSVSGYVHKNYLQEYDDILTTEQVIINKYNGPEFSAQNSTQFIMLSETTVLPKTNQTKVDSDNLTYGNNETGTDEVVNDLNFTISTHEIQSLPTINNTNIDSEISNLTKNYTQDEYTISNKTFDLETETKEVTTANSILPCNSTQNPQNKTDCEIPITQNENNETEVLVDDTKYEPILGQIDTYNSPVNNTDSAQNAIHVTSVSSKSILNSTVVFSQTETIEVITLKYSNSLLKGDQLEGPTIHTKSTKENFVADHSFLDTTMTYLDDKENLNNNTKHSIYSDITIAPENDVFIFENLTASEKQLTLDSHLNATNELMTLGGPSIFEYETQKTEPDQFINHSDARDMGSRNEKNKSETDSHIEKDERTEFDFSNFKDTAEAEQNSSLITSSEYRASTVSNAFNISRSNDNSVSTTRATSNLEDSTIFENLNKAPVTINGSQTLSEKNALISAVTEKIPKINIEDNHISVVNYTASTILVDSNFSKPVNLSETKIDWVDSIKSNEFEDLYENTNTKTTSVLEIQNVVTEKSLYTSTKNISISMIEDKFKNNGTPDKYLTEYPISASKTINIFSVDSIAKNHTDMYVNNETHANDSKIYYIPWSYIPDTNKYKIGPIKLNNTKGNVSNTINIIKDILNNKNMEEETTFTNNKTKLTNKPFKSVDSTPYYLPITTGIIFHEPIDKEFLLLKDKVNGISLKPTYITQGQINEQKMSEYIVISDSTVINDNKIKTHNLDSDKTVNEIPGTLLVTPITTAAFRSQQNELMKNLVISPTEKIVQLPFTISSRNLNIEKSSTQDSLVQTIEKPTTGIDYGIKMSTSMPKQVYDEKETDKSIQNIFDYTTYQSTSNDSTTVAVNFHQSEWKQILFDTSAITFEISETTKPSLTLKELKSKLFEKTDLVEIKNDGTMLNITDGKDSDILKKKTIQQNLTLEELKTKLFEKTDLIEIKNNETKLNITDGTENDFIKKKTTEQNLMLEELKSKLFENTNSTEMRNNQNISDNKENNFLYKETTKQTSALEELKSILFEKTNSTEMRNNQTTDGKENNFANKNLSIEKDEENNFSKHDINQTIKDQKPLILLFPFTSGKENTSIGINGIKTNILNVPLAWKQHENNSGVSDDNFYKTILFAKGEANPNITTIDNPAVHSIIKNVTDIVSTNITQQVESNESEELLKKPDIESINFSEIENNGQYTISSEKTVAVQNTSLEKQLDQSLEKELTMMDIVDELQTLNNYTSTNNVMDMKNSKTPTHESERLKKILFKTKFTTPSFKIINTTVSNNKKHKLANIVLEKYTDRKTTPIMVSTKPPRDTTVFTTSAIPDFVTKEMKVKQAVQYSTKTYRKPLMSIKLSHKSRFTSNNKSISRMKLKIPFLTKLQYEQPLIHLLKNTESIETTPQLEQRKTENKKKTRNKYIKLNIPKFEKFQDNQDSSYENSKVKAFTEEKQHPIDIIQTTEHQPRLSNIKMNDHNEFGSMKNYVYRNKYKNSLLSFTLNSELKLEPVRTLTQSPFLESRRNRVNGYRTKKMRPVTEMSRYRATKKHDVVYNTYQPTEVEDIEFDFAPVTIYPLVQIKKTYTNLPSYLSPHVIYETSQPQQLSHVTINPSHKYKTKIPSKNLKQDNKRKNYKSKSTTELNSIFTSKRNKKRNGVTRPTKTTQTLKRTETTTNKIKRKKQKSTTAVTESDSTKNKVMKAKEIETVTKSTKIVKVNLRKNKNIMPDPVITSKVNKQTNTDKTAQKNKATVSTTTKNLRFPDLIKPTKFQSYLRKNNSLLPTRQKNDQNTLLLQTNLTDLLAQITKKNKMSNRHMWPLHNTDETEKEELLKASDELATKIKQNKDFIANQATLINKINNNVKINKVDHDKFLNNRNRQNSRSSSDVTHMRKMNLPLISKIKKFKNAKNQISQIITTNKPVIERPTRRSIFDNTKLINIIDLQKLNSTKMLLKVISNPKKSKQQTPVEKGKEGHKNNIVTINSEGYFPQRLKRPLVRRLGFNRPIEREVFLRPKFPSKFEVDTLHGRRFDGDRRLVNDDENFERPVPPIVSRTKYGMLGFPFEGRKKPIKQTKIKPKKYFMDNDEEEELSAEAGTTYNPRYLRRNPRTIFFLSPTAAPGRPNFYWN